MTNISNNISNNINNIQIMQLPHLCLLIKSKIEFIIDSLIIYFKKKKE